MRTLIVEGHVRDVTTRPIGQAVADALCVSLAAVDHIHLSALVAFDGTLNLYAVAPLSTYEAVVSLRHFAAVTDARIHRHWTVAP